MQTQRVTPYMFDKTDQLPYPVKIVRLEKRGMYDFNRAHRHGYYEVFMFEQGGGEHIIDFQAHSIQNRSVHFIAPGQVHQFHVDDEISGWAIQFKPGFVLDELSKTDLGFFVPYLYQGNATPTVKPASRDFEELVDLTARLEKESNDPQQFSEMILRNYLHIFLRKCQTLEGQDLALSREVLPTRLRTFRELLEANFKQWHLPQQYAAVMQITPKHLSDLVKQGTGKTAGELIRERICLEAQRLLFYTDWSAKTIAYELQFEDPSHFSRFFKMYTGYSAQSYRDVIRQQVQPVVSL